MSLEFVRQKCIEFRHAERLWKKNTPKGKKYVGYKFVPFRSISKEGWANMGWEAKPIYKKKRSYKRRCK